jgi:hypothetical protein
VLNTEIYKGEYLNHNVTGPLREVTVTSVGTDDTQALGTGADISRVVVVFQDKDGKTHVLPITEFGSKYVRIQR